MNSILKQDLEEIIHTSIIDWNKLQDKSILVTGATGLIGSILVKSLLLKNKQDNLNSKVFLVVRNLDEANEIFENEDSINYIVSDIKDYEPKALNIDYIIHGASPTKSRFFIEKPVETMDISIIGTKKILEQAKICNVKSMVYLSSMEMYGVLDSNDVQEDVQGFIDPLNTRSSYSQSKRICELYSYSYYDEYNVPVKIARIAQTFGAGISSKESRVFKVFADSILKQQDIILKSEGSSSINFSYTTDTVIGILCILLNGKNGEAYNLVSNATNMTILDSAKWLAQKYGKGLVNVKIQISKKNFGFAPNNNIILNNKKIKSIGWRPKYDLKQGYDRLLKYLEEEENN
jgi:UDP-glucuronate decarboxylase